LLADFIPLMPSGARRAGAAKVMAARVGREPSVLVDQPRITQLLALSAGAAGHALTEDQAPAVRMAAAAGPIGIVQLLRHLEMKSIQRDYDKEKRKRLRELDAGALLDDSGWFGMNGSARLGAVSAYETMRDRKYRGYSSVAEAGDALHLAASGMAPMLGLPASAFVSVLDNREAQNRRNLHKKAAAEFVKESVLGFKALTGHTGPIKAFLKQLRADDVVVKRVRPATVGAQLPNTGSLPVGTSGGSGYVRGSWDPARQTFRNTEIEVAKGMPRHTLSMQPAGAGFRYSYGQGAAGGTNPSPIASLLHEGGHHGHHRAMRRAGIGDSMGGHEVPGLPHMDSVMNELGANNAALQFLQQAGAKPEALAYFKGARQPSFRSYVKNLPQTNNPVQERILAAGQHGFTPGYKGLPDLYMGKQADFTEQRNIPTIPLYIAAALGGIAGSAGASHWAHSEITDTPPLGVDKWRDTIRSISGTEPLMAKTRGVGNAFFAKPQTEQQAIAVLLEASGLGGQFVDAPGRTPHVMPSVSDMRQRGVRADTVRDLMQRGIMVADESAGAPVLGHEAGHAKIEETPGMLRFLQRHIYPHNRWVAPAASVGSMAAGLASGSALKGGLYGTGIGLLSGLGTLGPEAGASYHALQHLKGTGDGSLTAEGRKDLLSALSTYLAAAVLPSTLSGAAGGWISGRRRKKEEDEEGVEKAASRWRLLGNIGKVFKAQGGNIDQLAAGQNLAALKQTMGQTMRAPSADKIGQRVLQHERNAMNAARAPYRGDDDAMKAFVDRTRQRSTHERLFDRLGQGMPDFDEGSRVFRGTVGGNPWGGGSFDGAFHYASPRTVGAAFYGRQPAPFLANEARGVLAGGGSTLETVHHYGAGPNQRMWHPWGPEDAVTASARERARIMRRVPAQLSGNAETAVMPQHNPHLGTALRVTSRDGAYGASTFFPAGRPGQAAQNYVDQVSKVVRMAPDGTLRTMGQQVPGLTTTSWQKSVDASMSLKRLQQRNQPAFQAVMKRRADRMLGPSGFEKVANAAHGLVANDPDMEILDVAHPKAKVLYHGSGKKLDELDPAFNTKKDFGYEYGKPVAFAGESPSTAFTASPTEEYQALKEKLKQSIYHRLIDPATGAKLLLGHHQGGFIHEFDPADFVKVKRRDKEGGKHVESEEYVTTKKVKPKKVYAPTTFDVDSIPEYEYLGQEHVGEMTVDAYLAKARDKKVIAAVQAWRARHQEKAAAAKFYHGSATPELKVLEPRPSRLLDGESAVFMSRDKDFATTFAAPWRDEDFEHGTEPGKQGRGQIYMREEYPGAFEKKLNRPGYLYAADDVDDAEHNDRMSKRELISRKRVTVSLVRKIENLLEDLRKTKTVRLMKHGEKAPWDVEKVASAKHLLNVAQTLRRITIEGLKGDAADTLARPLGSTARTLQRYFFKHPKISSLGIRPGMPEQNIQALLKGLTDPPAMPALPPPAAPQQGMLDLFKSGAHPALPELLAAKEHSDAKRYSIKNRLIRQNMRRKADDWLVDSDDGKGIVGVTHIPTGFRLHMPKAIVDPDVLRYHNAT
jgi:hypothetical protein